MNAPRFSVIIVVLLAGSCAVGWAQQGPTATDQQGFDVISAKSIFKRDRQPPKIPDQPPPPPILLLQEQFVLRGVVFHDGSFHAFVEGIDGKMTPLRLGDSVADGEVVEIQLDGIRYRKDGEKESVWVGPGRNLTGSVSNLRESRR